MVTYTVDLDIICIFSSDLVESVTIASLNTNYVIYRLGRIMSRCDFVGLVQHYDMIMIYKYGIRHLRYEEMELLGPAYLIRWLPLLALKAASQHCKP